MTAIQKQYAHLITNIGDLLALGRQKAFQSVNTVLVETYWNIGRQIVEYEQDGNEKAEYGSKLLKKLAKDLSKEYGRGFSKSNIYAMRQFYLKFPIFQSVSGKLSWTHYVELLSISDDLAFSFYLKEAEREKWSVRELKRQIQSALFERLALSKNKEGVLALAQQGQLPSQARDIVKDPYVFEFLKLEAREQWLEKDLENELIDKLGQFLLELGKGFAFVGKQYRITLDNTHFYVDLVFYHRILKCFVLIDLKKGKVNHQDIGQMNLYLNYFSAEENTEGDNPPIGIVLGADKDDILVEYATANITNQLFVSKYQLLLPNREELKEKLREIIEH